MVYYNPDDEDPKLIYDISIAIEIIDDYIHDHLSFPKNPISPEKEIELAQKRQGLEQLKAYIIEHRFEDLVLHLIDDYAYSLKCQAAGCSPDTEAYQLFCNMYDITKEITYKFV